jgi:hypothetical protein
VPLPPSKSSPDNIAKQYRRTMLADLAVNVVGDRVLARSHARCSPRVADAEKPKRPLMQPATAAPGSARCGCRIRTTDNAKCSS